MDTAVVVALPALNEKIHQISSEPQAHMTILYLADNEDLETIMLHVQHVASKLHPFSLTWDRRGTLGEDEADVLFFDQDDWSMPSILDFRHGLLSNDAVKRAYDSVEQYPSWTPHLTIGYPERPTREPEDGYIPTFIHFDRIAVWTENEEGPVFQLTGKESLMSVPDVAMHSEEAKALSHYGVKGMKWGVRRDNGHEGERVKTKKLEKLDKQWEKEMSRTAYIKLHNAAAEKMNNGGIDKINNKPEYKDVDFNDPKNSALYNQYLNEHQSAFERAMVEAGPSLGMNPSGTKKFVIRKNADGEDDVFLDEVSADEVKHAEGDVRFSIRLSTDTKGHVTKYTPEEQELKHYGVKGMKWGVRRSDTGKAAVTKIAEKQSRRESDKAVQVSQRKPGTFVKTKGGARGTATEDAIRAHASRQRAKKSTTDSLSNAELKQAVERMRLEQEYSKLDKKVKRRGESLVSRMLNDPEIQRQLLATL